MASGRRAGSARRMTRAPSAANATATPRLPKATQTSRLWSSPGLEQTVLDQPCRPSAPRVVRAHAKPAVTIGNGGTRPSIADQESDCVFGAADPPHNADEGLVCAQLQRDGAVAAVALAQRMC